MLSGFASFAEPVQHDTTVQTQTTVNTSSGEVLPVSEVPETIPEKNAESLKKIKDSAETSKLFGVLAVLLVLSFVGLFFFAGFKLYRKWINRGYIVESSPKETLASPKDFKSAINLFLEKTDE